MDSVAQQVLMGGEKSTPPGQQVFTVASTNWTVPAGVTSISVVAVGRGGYRSDYDSNGFYAGGGGGALAYVNNLTVTPGEVLTIAITSAYSAVFRSSTALCNAGAGNKTSAGTVAVGSGGSGGDGKLDWLNGDGGSGGAGGYSGKGGNGGVSGGNGMAGNGGGGGGGGSYGYSGGGVGLLGEGASGGASTNVYNPGLPGSGGTEFTYGGGGYGPGAVRIIWPGNLRQFPSTRTTDE